MRVISERKQQVIGKAEELFSQKGYLATSVRDLAQALNIEAASLYSHVKSKEDLLWTIADRSADAFFERVGPIAAQDIRTEDKLTKMIVEHVCVITDHLAASAVFFREWKHLSDPRRSEYAKRISDYERIWRGVVLQGVEENLFKNYDEGFSSRTLLSAINWTHTWYRPDGELSPQQIGENLASFLLSGLTRTI